MKLNKAREKLVDMYLNSLKEEKLPWYQGWDNVHQYNPITKTVYHGVNKTLLNIVSESRGYTDPRWLTFNQIKSNEWNLENAKGQGVPVEYWSVYDTLNKKSIAFTDYYDIVNKQPERLKDFKIMDRTYYVFNGSLVKGIPELELEEKQNKILNPSPFVENLINKMGVRYQEHGNRAFYVPDTDTVTVPESSQFHNRYAFEATRLHELCHATGHNSRLNRKIDNSFGTVDYAKEELRAEISSSFIAQDMMLEPSPSSLENHKAYIQSWIQILENEPVELFRAIKDADKICDFVINTGELEKFIVVQESDVALNEIDMKATDEYDITELTFESEFVSSIAIK